jgi:hypothetical protein
VYIVYSSRVCSVWCGAEDGGGCIAAGECVLVVYIYSTSCVVCRVLCVVYSV